MRRSRDSHSVSGSMASGDIAPHDRLNGHSSRARELYGVVIGALVGFAADTAPLVDFPGNPRDNAVVARTTVLLSSKDVGREVALLFEDGDPSKPILVGPIIPFPQHALDRYSPDRDDERLVISTAQEIVLRCGKASIILTRAGKVLIRGEYVSSQSRGVNKIKGGAVHIN